MGDAASLLITRWLMLVSLAFAQLATSAASAAGLLPPAQGFVREYALDHPGSGPAIVAVDEEDRIWVALAKAGKLARFSESGVELFDLGADSRPVGLAVGTRANGHSGVIWIAASYDNKLLRFDVASRQVRAYPIEGDKSWPFIVTLGPDGTVWFTQRASGRIGRLDPDSGTIRQYAVPTPNAGPAGMAVEPRSGLVWFTESYADRIGVLDPATGSVREFKMGETSTGLVSGPAGLALDAEGGVWFTKLEGKLGHLRPGSEQIELISVPAEGRRPAGIAVGRNGDVWALALDGNLLLRYRPSTRRFTLYPIPTGGPDDTPLQPPAARTSRPFGLALDRQGNVWFSEQYTGQLGVLDVAPPLVTILSPPDTVRTRDPLLTVQALDRVAGVERLAVVLDGKPVMAAGGRLDLSTVQPGPHRIEVTAVDAAGLSTVVTREFQYSPGPEALQRVRLLDAPPHFAPVEVLVRKGDPVVWQYDPPSDGHTGSHHLHRIELPGLGVQSGLLRSGDSFSHRFERGGEFIVTDSEWPGARAIVRVVE